MNLRFRGNPISTLFVLIFTSISLFLSFVIWDRTNTNLINEEMKSQYSSNYLKSRISNNINTSSLVLNNLKDDVENKNYLIQGPERYSFLYDYFKDSFTESLSQTFKNGGIVLKDKNGDFEISVFNNKRILKGDVIFKRKIIINGEKYHLELFISQADKNIYFSLGLEILDSYFNKIGDINIVSEFIPSEFDNRLSSQQSVIVLSGEGELYQYFGGDREELHLNAITSFKESVSLENDDMFTRLDLSNINNIAIHGFLFFSKIAVITSSSNKGMGSKSYYVYLAMLFFIVSVLVIIYITSIGVKIKSNYFNRRIAKRTVLGDINKSRINTFSWYDKDQLSLIKSTNRLLFKIQALKIKSIKTSRVDKLSGLLNEFSFIEDSKKIIQEPDKVSVLIISLRSSAHYFYKNSACNDEKYKKIKEIIDNAINSIKNNGHLGYRIYKINVFEYAVIIKNTNDLKTLNIITDSILRAFNEGKIDTNKEQHALNIGYASNKNNEFIDIANNAKKALELSIERQVEKLFYEDEIAKHFSILYAIEKDLKHAIDNDLLYLEYTPLYNIRKKQMIGVKIISRWSHYVEGDIPNSQFTGLAKSLGLAQELSYWKVRNSFIQIQSWNRQGLRKIQYHIKINLCFIMSDFFENLMISLISEFDLNDSLIFLSLTDKESFEMMRDHPELFNIINRIGLNIDIAISKDYYLLSYDINKIHARSVSMDLYENKNSSEKYKADRLKLIEQFSAIKNISFFIGNVNTTEELERIKENTTAFVSGQALNGSKISHEIEELFQTRIRHI